ncbi:hypothetical protein HPB50_000343 [Hyalomma asiaticum]|uniref:Uncharacterized protein n=1 Tax=Hyalomma asiaticum TaxID=266040 RepID=A0ACB7S4B7_HYAAI|nr:hypothetical protein HPB50_000343 [Hyalomma asiaticum]
MAQRLFRNDTISFTAGEANAFYEPMTNSLTIKAGVIQPPLFFKLGPASLNYAGLGQIIGHEIMHGYDVDAIRLDAFGRLIPIANTSSMLQYQLRVFCLRQTYLQAEAERALVLVDDKLDSEGFADFTGLQLAYAAYKRLEPRERLAVVPGVGLTAEQTFFVAHCLKWCDLIARRHPSSRYWPGRSRCIVPLRSMPEFAAAFSCTEGAPMNPHPKCTFWE